ncbi:hypothetical protein PSEUBRA_002977 [Kalmanozyma brasiliensis GHG001]|uniref:Uncharacterized protein n=1 Tax=Kalmanozyma brasiliensis (strain GHG001) TaxID=1365824 RepID=V5EYL0_KALBG|nr:uncharacterized protein PSEUBRA_002977 [Kalmanozyma brasiliensis GHG001]EST07859.1 hypothetical protein PSEUBRA_002977 [Kalmanozyma brasiliensis GHG001]
MIASRIQQRASTSLLATAASRRLNSTTSRAAAPGARPSSTKGQGLDRPQAILWGWAALIVVAGFGYYTVKSNNTAKKRDFMIKQGQLQQQRSAVTDGDQPAATSTPVLMSSTNQEKYAQSPLQSLTAAFNRQTTQRSRNTDASRSNGGRDE